MSKAAHAVPSSHRHPSKARRRLNVRLLVASAIILLLLIPAVAAWHTFQARRVAEAMLTEAERLEAAGEYGEASGYLYRFLEMKPDDPRRPELMARLAQDFDRGATRTQDKPAAIQWYYRAIGAAPERLDLQVRLGELFLETNQPVMADQQMREALKAHPDEIELQRILVLAQYIQFREGRPVDPGQISDDLLRVNERLPENVQVAEAAASLLRDRAVADPQAVARADNLINRLVETNPDNYQSHLVRYHYRSRYGLPNANVDLQKAIELGGQQAEVLVVAAGDALRSADYQAAAEYYRQLLQLGTSLPAAYLGLGESLYRLGDPQEACRVWRDGLKAVQNTDLSLSIRLAEVLIEQKHLDQATRQLEAVDQQIRQLAARGQESDRDWAVASRDLLRAQVLLAEGKTTDAIPLLERVATTAKLQRQQDPLRSSPYLAWMLLGRTHMQLEQWNDAQRAFERAQRVAPLSAQARIGSARTLAKLGQFDQALVMGEQAVAASGATPDVWESFVTMRFHDLVRQPPSQQDWRALLNMLPLAEQAAPDSWQIRLMHANLLALAGDERSKTQALSILDDMNGSADDSLSHQTDLAFAYESLGEQDKADRLLEQLESSDFDRVDLLVRKATLHVLRGEFDRASELLGTLPDDDPRTVRTRLFLAQRTGDPRQLRDALIQQLETLGDPHSTLIQLANLALWQRQWPELGQWADRLRENSSEDVWWRFFDARRLMESSADDQATEWNLAHDRLLEIESRQPDWPGAAFLRGRLAERDRQTDLALDLYLRAHRAGFEQPDLTGRVVALLQRQGRWADAEQWMSTGGPVIGQAGNPLEVSWVSIDRNDVSNKELKLAEYLFHQNSADLSVRIDYARRLWLADRRDEANELMSAVEVEQVADATSWLSLLRYWLLTGETTLARQTLEQLPEQSELTEKQRELTFAEAWRALGEFSLAAEHFERAIQLASDDYDVQVRYAMFLHPLDPAKAEDRLRSVLRHAPRHAVARRLLAAWLHWQVDPDAQLEAEQLLNSDESSGSDLQNDRRLEAILLVQRGSASDLQRARVILQRLIQQNRSALLSDHWLLASVYERMGEINLAEQQFLTLVDRTEAATPHLGAYIDFLLRHDRSNDVQRWLDELIKQSPHAYRTLRLQARTMVALGQSAQAVELIQRFGQEKLSQVRDLETRRVMAAQIGSLLESLGQPQPAEEWYRRAAESEDDSPEPLVDFLIRQDRAGEAIAECIRRYEQRPSERTATSLARVMTLADGSAHAQAEALLTEAGQQFASDPSFLFALSNFRLKQGQTEVAIELLEQLTQLAPEHINGWNNLAALLANDPTKHDEAMTYIDRGLTQAGQAHPNLLDTKAVLLLQSDDAARASSLLMQALANPEANDPRFYLHLSIAFLRMQRMDEAQAAWRQAQQRQLSRAFLTQYEQQWVHELDQRFAQSVDAS